MGFMPIPQRMTAVTFGARSVSVLRAFYRAVGWQENDGSDDTFTSFTMGSVRLALYSIESLRDEAAPGEEIPSGSWNGMTMSLNVASRREVDDALSAAAEAGAVAVGASLDRDWGGYSGYFTDPEGHRWEIAWAPWLTEFD